LTKHVVGKSKNSGSGSPSIAPGNNIFFQNTDDMEFPFGIFSSSII
jgi:hypothetical protein